MSKLSTLRSNLKSNKDFSRLNNQYTEYLKILYANHNKSKDTLWSNEFSEFLKSSYFEPVPGAHLGKEYQKLIEMGYLIRCSEQIEITDIAVLAPEIVAILKSNKSKKDKLVKIEEYFELSARAVILDESIAPYMVEAIDSMNKYLGEVAEGELQNMATYRMAENKHSEWEMDMRRIANGYFFRVGEEIYAAWVKR
jgi:hypothetical protein